MLEEEQRYGPAPSTRQGRRRNDTAGEIHYLARPSGRPQMLCFAESTEELTGYIADRILADRLFWANIIYPADRTGVFSAYDRCKKHGVGFETEYRIVHKDGRRRYVVDKGRPVINDKGRITHIEGTITGVKTGSRTKTALVRD